MSNECHHQQYRAKHLCPGNHVMRVRERGGSTTAGGTGERLYLRDRGVCDAVGDDDGAESTRSSIDNRLPGTEGCCGANEITLALREAWPRGSVSGDDDRERSLRPRSPKSSLSTS